MKMLLHPAPNSLRLFCAGLTLAALSISPARAATLYDFNGLPGTNQLTDNFTQGDIDTSSSVGGTLTNATTGGLGNSGSLQIPAATTDSFIYTTNASVSATFASINVSVYFKAAPSTNNGAALTTTIGLVDAKPTASDGGAPVGVPSPIGESVNPGFFAANSFTLSLRNTGKNSDVSGLQYTLVSYNNGGGALSTSSAAILTDGNWYLLEAAYTYNGANSYSLTGQIYNSDSNGVVGSSLITSGNSWTATNAGLADGDTYFLLSSQNGERRGLSRLDNYGFSAVPEPSTALLLGGGLGLLALRRRRKIK